MIPEKRNESSFPAVPDSRYKIHRASWANGPVEHECLIKAEPVSVIAVSSSEFQAMKLENFCLARW